ncbi:hypothetical protein [uncultured Luteimonas sp.]|uniref:hypothetical protein n=1 Tax=uncultured Luteimonas sp. TaxID=453144 RepID=UPI00262E637C|nr:hypothetical protein [uncultured Luteimonas sp.]
MPDKAACAPARDRGGPKCDTARPFSRGEPVAKPNYSFEKRQRELAKKKKQDEKDAKKRAEREAKAATQGTPQE